MKLPLTLLFLFIPLLCARGGCANNECDKNKNSGEWSIQKIGDCPEDKTCTRRKDDDGKNHRYDPELDTRKNIWADDAQEKPTLQTIEWMKHDLERHPVSCKDRCPSRKRLKELGEGKKITVVAWALTARRGGVETANCDIPYVRKEGDVNTDNHIVLVDPTVTNPTLDQKTEWDSVTAEFTPRVRLHGHANFTREGLNPLIDPNWKPKDDNPHGKRLVRVTGLLMFDTGHLCVHQLRRATNWEIHPILKLEYCDEGKTCVGESDENWKNLDDLPVAHLSPTP